MTDPTAHRSPNAAAITNVHVRNIAPLMAPGKLAAELPVTDAAQQTVLKARDAIQQIILGQDRRLLVIVGPCSIHDQAAAMDYARRLKAVSDDVSQTLCLVMRVYFEKPRTTVGWKGLINDPDLNDTFEIEKGLRRARQILLDINGLGLPAATELLDPIVPQYIAGLISWAAIGARTTESQTHRQMASGLSMPVGYKNSTDGNVQTAINAMLAARVSHSFLGINDAGQSAVIHTLGNRWGHLILRGGASSPNFDVASIEDAARRLAEAGLSPSVMVDCSHANSGKHHEQQEVVWQSVVEQHLARTPNLIGMMLESNLGPGRQDLGPDPSTLKYGVSITDECVGWEKTEQLLRSAHDALKGKI